MAQVHNRMPLILSPEQEAAWLTTEPDKTASLLDSLQPLSPELMEMYSVSRNVNSGRIDSPELILRGAVGP
jgi:putative SOS response-associated peptidase YedK